MDSFDRAYPDALEEIECKGFTKGDRTGTERYRQMTLDEMKTELSKHYGKTVNVLIGLEGTSRVGANSDQEEGHRNIHVVMDEFSLTSETLVSGKAEYEAWQIAYRLMREEQLRKEISKQQVEDGWDEVTFVKNEDIEDSWAMEAEVGSSVRQVIYGGLTSLLSLYEFLVGKPFDMEPRVLTDK